MENFFDRLGRPILGRPSLSNNPLFKQRKVGCLRDPSRETKKKGKSYEERAKGERVSSAN